MKTIIIALALLTIGCKKVEEPTQKQVVTAPVTVEDKEYMFSQQVGYTNIQLTDMNGNPVGSVNNYGNSCIPAHFVLEDSVEYRLTFNMKNNANVFNILLWEGVITSNNHVLTLNKTGGTKNIFSDGSCGLDIYVVK
jgi:hypothetical protein